MCLFSFVIPIFNSEKYIEKCLQSLMCQTLNDYEVIIIDDGSNDHSIEICNYYEKNFKRCKIISKPLNKGACIARNEGILHSHGKYISFLDSDDTVCPFYCESLSKKIKEYDYPDVIEFLMTYYDENNKPSIQGTVLREGFYDSNFIKSVFLPVHLECKNDTSLHYTLFNTLRVIKRELLTQNMVQFNPKVKRWEDWAFAMKVFFAANNMVVVKLPLYNYFFNNFGNRLLYKAETYYYIALAYQEIDELVNNRYNMFSNYAIKTKLEQFKNCISEIINFEKNEKICEQNVINVLKNDYFQKLLSYQTDDNEWNILLGLLENKKYLYAFDLAKQLVS